MASKIYIGFIVAFILFLTYGVLNQKKDDPKAKRVACQKSVTTFEKIYKKDIQKAKELLKSSNYNIESYIEYSQNMKSNLKNSFSNKDSDKILVDVLKSFETEEKQQNEKLLISYFIYENDKKDEGKKNKDAFLYAGYLVFEFKLKDELLYKIQIDYTNIDTSDIKSRMSCVTESFLTI